jgi:hypothetical protein
MNSAAGAGVDGEEAAGDMVTRAKCKVLGNFYEYFAQCILDNPKYKYPDPSNNH